LIGGALLIPAISNVMGSILLRLSKRSNILRHLLAVRPPLGGVHPPPLGTYTNANWETMGYFKQFKLGLQLVLGSFWGGTATWQMADPVWWRNSIGLGLFVVAKDCIHLFHLWLVKRELETRRVKSRNFSGVDIKELDLIPSYFQRQ